MQIGEKKPNVSLLKTGNQYYDHIALLINLRQLRNYMYTRLKEADRKEKKVPRPFEFRNYGGTADFHNVS